METVPITIVVGQDDFVLPERTAPLGAAIGRDMREQLGVIGRFVPRMNRIFWVVRSMTKKIIELSRGVVAAPPMGKVTAESESISSTCRRRRLPIDGTSIQDPVAEVVRSRRRARIGAIHPGAGSVGAEAPARPGSANSAIPLSAAAGHHGGRSAGTRIDAQNLRREDENSPQRAAPALPAHDDVDSGQAQHHRLGRFRFTWSWEKTP